MKFLRFIVISFGSVFLGSHLYAAESLEAGMNELAVKITTESKSEGKTTLAISPFQHSDGNCSEMSVHIADELILNVFLADKDVQVVERAQLQSLFNELAFSGSGLVDANAPQEVGRLLGADAWIVGSVLAIGDKLRVSARLIETETGKVFSAAAVNVPRTDTMKELASRLIGNGCGFSRSKASEPVRPSASKQLAVSNQNRPKMSRSDDSIRYDILKILFEPSTGQLDLFQRLTNISGRTIRLTLLEESTIAFDDNLQTFWASKATGLIVCGARTNCFHEANILEPDEVIQVHYTLHPQSAFEERSKLSSKPLKDKVLAPNILTFRSRIRLYTGGRYGDNETRSAGMKQMPVR